MLNQLDCSVIHSENKTKHLLKSHIFPKNIWHYCWLNEFSILLHYLDKMGAGGCGFLELKYSVLQIMSCWCDFITNWLLTVLFFTEAVCEVLFLLVEVIVFSQQKFAYMWCRVSVDHVFFFFNYNYSCQTQQTSGVCVFLVFSFNSQQLFIPSPSVSVLVFPGVLDFRCWLHIRKRVSLWDKKLFRCW